MIIFAMFAGIALLTITIGIKNTIEIHGWPSINLGVRRAAELEKRLRTV